jgi:hypothetical protein
VNDTDVAIEEVRRARYEISARYKDVYAYVRHLMRVEARRGKRPQKRVKTRAVGGAARRRKVA